jgi:hypothetical protein
MDVRAKFRQIVDTPAGAEAAAQIRRYSESGVRRIESIGSSLSMQGRTAASRYMSLGQGVAGAYKSTVGAFGRAISSLGDMVEYERPTVWSAEFLRGTAAPRSRGGLSAGVGRMTRGVGNVIQRPVSSALKGAGIAAKKTVGGGFKGAMAFRRGIKSIPKPIRKMGLVGGIALGVTAMLGVSVLKGAMNQGRQIAYDRYMEDAAQSKNVLASTRLGNASGTNRMLGYGGTVGLANSLSRTRHGR